MKKTIFDKSLYGDNWEELSAACKKRDNYTCRKCGYNRRTSHEVRQLHADHIIPLTKNGPNKLSNLQTLCTKCHQFKTNRNRPKSLQVSWYSKSGVTTKKKSKITRLKRFRPK